MVKVVIQIPAFNEEAMLLATLRDLPRRLPGVDSVEWLVVDDGSTDRTVEAAWSNGADHVVSFGRHLGLAAAFNAGLEACLRAGADAIVNTDADNQYRAEDIAELIRPILNERADIVIGARPIDDIPEFSRSKKLLQKFGSWVVRLASGTDVPDAPSGFRAFSREAALRLNVFGKYSHTLETIIQAGHLGMKIVSVPVRVNPPLRPSRLMSGTGEYLWRSGLTVLRIFLTYKPMAFFFALGSVPAAFGVAALCSRLLGNGGTDVPWVACFLIAFHLWLAGLIANLLAVNRRLIEDTRLRVRRIELETHWANSAQAETSVKSAQRPD